MNAQLVTLSGMAHSKDGSAGKKPNRKPSYVLYARIKPSIGKALEDYMGQTRPRPDKTAVIETALEDFLATQGFWPPGLAD